MILDIDQCRRVLFNIAAKLDMHRENPTVHECAQQIYRIAEDMNQPPEYYTGVILDNRIYDIVEPPQNKKCPWCGHTPEVLDARDLMNCKEDSIDYDIKYPYFVRCINAMCNVQPITCGAETKERALEQWNTMQSAASIGLC